MKDRARPPFDFIAVDGITNLTGDYQKKLSHAVRNKRSPNIKMNALEKPF